MWWHSCLWELVLTEGHRNWGLSFSDLLWNEHQTLSSNLKHKWAISISLTANFRSIPYFRHYHMGAESHIYASVNQNIIVLNDGISPDQCWASIWTNVGMVFLWHLGRHFSDIWIKIWQYTRRWLWICPLQNLSCFVSALIESIKTTSNVLILPRHLISVTTDQLTSEIFPNGFWRNKWYNSIVNLQSLMEF